MTKRAPFRPATTLAACAFCIAACGGTAGGSGGSGGTAGMAQDGGPGRDAPSEAPDRSSPETSPETSSETSGPPDGTPHYTASCTPLSSETGTAIDTYHGRLDGYLTYVVPVGGPYQCNGDGSHVHLQVTANGSVYDVAVDVGHFSGDADFYEADMPMPDGAWSEGWHGSDALTYISLGLHSSQFTPEDPMTLGAKIQSELSGKNHISVFGVGYSQGNGCHDVHYENGNGNDGAIVIDPLSPTAHMLFFRFSTDSF